MNPDYRTKEERLAALRWLAKRLAGDVTVYGAVGDGVHDDTAAIHAAMQATGMATLPAGRYVYHGRSYRAR